VDLKWKCALNSNRTLRLGREAIKWLDDDYDRLLKVQQQDLGIFSDQVDSATLSVAGLAALVESGKAKDICGEIDKIDKQIEELLEQSNVLNRKQKIFGLPELMNEALVQLTIDIEPFKIMCLPIAVEVEDLEIEETEEEEESDEEEQTDEGEEEEGTDEEEGLEETDDDEVLKIGKGKKKKKEGGKPPGATKSPGAAKPPGATKPKTPTKGKKGK